MKRPLRLVLGLASVLVLFLVVALVSVDSLVEQAVERGGTHALGVETRLGDARIGLFSGRFGLEDLALANPPGFARPDFFALRSARLELPLARLLERRIEIPSLELEGITLDLERGAKGTNYGVILDHLARFQSGTAEPAGGPAAGEGKTYCVQRLVLRDVRASLQLVPVGGDATKLDLALGEIVVEDLASDMTLAQLCGVVVQVVVQAAVQAGAGSIPAELLDDLRARVDGLEEAVRLRLDAELGALESELGAQAKQLGPEAEKALQQAGDKLGEALGGLLDKGKKAKD